MPVENLRSNKYLNINKILIRFPETKTTTITCDDRTIFQTEEGLWVSERPTNKKLFKKISAIPKWNMTDSPDLHQMMEVSNNFLIYSINNKLSLTHNNIKTTQCRFQNRLKFDTYKDIEDNTFIRDLGDSIALTKCKQLVVPLDTNSKICFQDIKMANNLGFIDCETHIFKKNFNKSL